MVEGPSLPFWKGIGGPFGRGFNSGLPERGLIRGRKRNRVGRRGAFPFPNHWREILIDIMYELPELSGYEVIIH